MELPYELKILPPQALDVLMFLREQADGQADAIAICEGADLSNRAFGKAIRRLVTRNYLSMDTAGYYRLTSEGHKATKVIGQYRAAQGDQASSQTQEETVQTVSRRLTVVTPKALGAGSPAQLYAGIEAPDAANGILDSITSLVLRFEGVNCEVEPPERTLKVPPTDAAEPATLTLIAQQAGQARVRVRAYQLTRADEVEEVGGMYFDLLTNEAKDTGLQALSIDLELHS